MHTSIIIVSYDAFSQRQVHTMGNMHSTIAHDNNHFTLKSKTWKLTSNQNAKFVVIISLLFENARILLSVVEALSLYTISITF